MNEIGVFRLILIINLLLITSVNNAQVRSISVLEDVMEDISVNNEEVDEPNWENQIEELSERIRQPINLNSVTKEELEQFPFLSDIQIENLLAYLYVNGQMQSVYELQLVKDMDRNTIGYLLPFVCVKPVHNSVHVQWKDLFRYGKHQLLTRLDVPFYTRKGYEKTYLGPSMYHSMKYAFRYQDHLDVGVTGEKDAGEPFGALHNKQGYDYYSYYLLVRNVGRLKTLALGNYRLSFGQGLVMSTDFLLGKSAYSSSFDFRSKGIQKHSLTDEYNYFRGVAAAVDVTKQVALSAFYSHRVLDGELREDEITSMDKSGWHRSAKEVERRNTFTLQLTGGNITYKQRSIQLGLTGIYYNFSSPYEPERKKYAKYDLHGKEFYNLGFDYAYRWHRFSIQGESAVGKSGWATLNRFRYSPTQEYKLTLVHRYYSHDYWAMFARSFSEGGRVQNENGWYLAAEASPLRYWKFFASIDMFSFPYWKYRISKPSQGIDGWFRTDYTPKENLTMYVDYRYKRKERDVTGTGGEVVWPTYHHRLRYRLNYTLDSLFSFCTTLHFNHFHSRGTTVSRGYQVAQMISYHVPRIPLKIDWQGSYFYTDDYDSRVYLPEKGLLYTFYTPSFQGKGIRYTLGIRYDFNRHWTVIAKWGQTVYYDRDEIGSGYDLIAGNKKADLQMQLCFKF